MAIGVLDVRPTTWEEMNPGFAGMQKMATLQQAMADAQAQQYRNAVLKEQAAVAQPMTLAELKAKQEEAPHMRAQTGLLGEQTKWFGPTAKSDIDYKNVETQYKKARIDPFNDPEHMPELLKAEAYYVNLKNKYGENDPITKEALNNYRMMQQSSQATAAWRQQLGESMGYRALPTLAKEQLTQQQIEAGLQPSALQNVPIGRIADSAAQNQLQSAAPPALDMNRPFGQPSQNLSAATQPQAIPQQAAMGQSMPTLGAAQAMAPQQQLQQAPQPAISLGDVTNPKPSARSSEMAEQFKNKILKDTTTSQNLNKIQFGAQVEQTFENMRPYEKYMEHYTGISGRTRLAKDTIEAQKTGRASPELIGYQQYMAHATSAARQMRQYWGDSIQPEAMKEIDALANPASWFTTPEMARATLNATMSNFNSELRQRRSAAKSSDLYSPNQPGVKEFAAPSTTPSAADIAFTAKKHGISEEDVKRRLGIR